MPTLEPGVEYRLPQTTNSYLTVGYDGQVAFVRKHDGVGAFAGNDAANGRRRAHDWESHRDMPESRYREDVMGWTTDPPATIAEAVGQAIGAGSTCFEDGVPRGVMDERRASLITDALLDQIEKHVHLRHSTEGSAAGPRLGLATNAELIEALWVRWNMGEREPEYQPEVSPEDMAAESMAGEALRRFSVDLIPSRFDVVVNGIRIGAIYRHDRDANRWSTMGARIPESIREAVLRIVRSMTPVGTDKPAEGDLGIVQAVLDTAPQTKSDREDEFEDDEDV